MNEAATKKENKKYDWVGRRNDIWDLGKVPLTVCGSGKHGWQPTWRSHQQTKPDRPWLREDFEPIDLPFIIRNYHSGFRLLFSLGEGKDTPSLSAVFLPFSRRDLC